MGFEYALARTGPAAEHAESEAASDVSTDQASRTTVLLARCAIVCLLPLLFLVLLGVNVTLVYFFARVV